MSMALASKLETLPNDMQKMILEFLSGFDIHIIYGVNTTLQRAAKVFFTHNLLMYMRDSVNTCTCKYFVDRDRTKGRSWKEMSVSPVICFQSREEVNTEAAKYFYPSESTINVNVPSDRARALQLLNKAGTVDLQDLLRVEDFADNSDYDSDRSGCSDDASDDSEDRAYDRYLQALGECEGSGWTVSAEFREVSPGEALREFLILLAEAHWFLKGGESGPPGSITGDFRSVVAIAMACFRSDLEPVECTYAKFGYDYRGQWRSSDMNTRVVQVSFVVGDGGGTQSISIKYFDRSVW